MIPFILPLGSSGGSHVAFTAFPFPRSGFTSKFSGGPDGAGKGDKRVKEALSRKKKEHARKRVQKLCQEAKNEDRNAALVCAVDL